MGDVPGTLLSMTRADAEESVPDPPTPEARGGFDLVIVRNDQVKEKAGSGRW
ncbi:hypothetical protein GCM10023336_22100 [Streptomyces similanensis]|uniref:Uncharacterized protein n=1 Tax=Streptomyces similanensis TaxID=1274988 RepID=A0ABP9K911_9ACTN